MYLWSYDPKHFEKPQFHAWVVCLDCGIYCAYTNHGSSTGLINWWLLQSLYMAHPPTSEQATSHGTSRQMCGTDVVQHHPCNLPQPGGIIINSPQHTWDLEEILNHSIRQFSLACHFCFQLHAHNHPNIQPGTPVSNHWTFECLLFQLVMRHSRQSSRGSLGWLWVRARHLIIFFPLENTPQDLTRPSICLSLWESLWEG